jgi:hypothetical protein
MSQIYKCNVTVEIFSVSVKRIKTQTTPSTSEKSHDFVTHAEQAIQIHNQSLCEERSNLTIKSKTNKSLERI